MSSCTTHEDERDDAIVANHHPAETTIENPTAKVDNNEEATTNDTDETWKNIVKWSGIISTGQSLSTGVQGDLSRPSTPATGGWMLADSSGKWNMHDPRAVSLSLVPLTEPIRPAETDSGEYPDNLDGQTPSSSMARQISLMAREVNKEKQKKLTTEATEALVEINTTHSAVGVAGEGMSSIQKGGTKNAYAAGLYEATALTRLVKLKLGKDKQGNITNGENTTTSTTMATLAYDAVVLTHGEVDSILTNHEYQDLLLQMQRDYAADLASITGQTHEPVLIVSQQQACPPAKDHISTVIQAQWRAQALSHDNKVVCSGPKYQYGYAPSELHLPVAGYNRLGEKYGQVYFQTVVEKRPFRPLSPTALHRVDARTIRVEFHVPVPPLQWDDTLPARAVAEHPSWTAGRGFEVRDANLHDVDIDAVAIDDGGESVTIHLGCGAYPGPLSVSYAMASGKDGFSGGEACGRIGHLCDSDPMVGAGAEAFRCQVKAGSSEIRCMDSPKRFQRLRALYDVVEPGAYTLMSIADDASGLAQLDRAWHGSSGQLELSFHHNHRNFLVSFYGRLLTPKQVEQGMDQFPVPLRIS